MRLKDGSERDLSFIFLATSRKGWKGYFTGFPNDLTNEIIGE